ncbi:hypothetical protein CAPTEDRAFT_148578 [Capitella teleta]|uniref:Methyltransferase type 12 domain-containing protein n=1 Tax=Capitella teleta TaxID=283909 RepID=R7U0H4_CAPTE|nr:hypothetical protein CAPTEDRAFT_148578 [Capitella teleta]|eukprot:ELT96705.1 hypothetical protein CAPTEDRAFT_148578 [Capitella teleta]
MLDLNQAEEAFKSILANISTDIIPDFLIRVRELAGDALSQTTNSDVFIQEIQDSIRSVLPTDALLPSEQFQSPAGQNHDCDQATTVHVDGFLYDDDTVDELCDQGKMSRNYCTQCGCRQVSPLNFISHSMTLKQLKYIMQYVMPDLRRKTLLDVGSRTGAVLYGAFTYSDASNIFGVELNADFCRLQQSIVEKFGMQERVKVIHGDICAQEQLLKQADVVIMNNVFEFFLNTDTQKNVWKFLRQSLTKTGSVLLTCPGLPESLQPLELVNIMDGWVDEIDTQQQREKAYKRLYDDPDSDELDAIHLYRIL